MRTNQVRTKLDNGQPVFGIMIHEFRSPSIMTILANAGYDFVFVDMEHGTYDFETAAILIQAARAVGLTPLARATQGYYPLMSRLLDSGAEGIMAPRINTRDEVEYVVNCIRYPPQGKRGLSVARGHNDYQRADPYTFMAHANQQNLVIIQIETRPSFENIDDLLSVPGVDIALIGPSDLSVAMGLPMDYKNPEFRSVLLAILQACKRHSVHAAIHANNIPGILDLYRNGLLMLSAGSDLDFIIDSSNATLSRLREGVAIKE
jgi:2-keto-3-deoxy-L-rhamnonate aldolase RhmA